MRLPSDTTNARAYGDFIRSGRWLTITAILATFFVCTSQPALAQAGGSVDFSTNLTRIDGFGFSEAFQRATIMRGDYGLTPENQRKILDLLFDTETGAGLSILRLGIGAAYPAPYDLQLSIQPNDPGGPDAPPQYEWNGDDGGQVWLRIKQAPFCKFILPA